jgi:hypothetical protein
MLPTLSHVLEVPVPKSKPRRDRAPMRSPSEQLQILSAAFRALNKRPLTPENKAALRSISLATLFVTDCQSG